MPRTKVKKSKRAKVEDLEPYSGKWVALRDSSVAYSAATLETLMKKVRKLGQAKNVSVMLVPGKGPYILSWQG